jgi:peptidoglycan DL-endopeptidase LytE
MLKKDKIMKRRSYIAVIIAAIALSCVSLPVYSKTKHAAGKASSKHKKANPIAKKAPQPTTSKYVVRQGDSLFKIAKLFNTTSKKIALLNHLQKNKIKAGQTLEVPTVKEALAKKAEPVKTAQSNPASETIMRQAPKASDAETSEDQPLRARLAQAGFNLIGVRYKRSGGSEKSGFDCSGLVKNLFSRFNIELPRSSREQYKQGEQIDRDRLEVGDLVFFSSGGSQPTHVGIYVGDNKMLHAALKAKHVIVSDLNSLWYKVRYLGARRIADLWGNDAPEEQK